MKKASAILMSDGHIRDDVPECRTDDYFAAFESKLQFISNLQQEHECPIIDAGDMFHKWQVSSEREGWALLNLPKGIITIPGNHDLPNHSLSLYKKSSLHVLEAANKLTVLKDNNAFYLQNVPMGKFSHGTKFENIPVRGFPYGTAFEKGVGIAIIHAYVGESIPPKVEGYTPKQLLAALPGYDLIVSGHNHQPLAIKIGNRLIVNPGSIMRMFADQVSMKPRVYLWYAETNTVTPVYLPIQTGVISREHIERKKEQSTRLDTFIERLRSDDVEISLSFEKNIENYFTEHKTEAAVRALVNEAMNGGVE